MVTTALVAERRFDDVESLAAEAVQLVREARMADLLDLRVDDERRWDIVALGEVMLRLDPGEGRISTARTFPRRRGWR